jgi:hypothetical protein
MTWHSIAISRGWRTLRRFAAWTAFIAAVLAISPFVIRLFAQVLWWFAGWFHRPDDLWKECPWCF